MDRNEIRGEHFQPGPYISFMEVTMKKLLCLLLAVCLLAVPVTAFAAEGGDDTVYTLRVSTTRGDSTWFAQMYDDLFAELTEASGGRLQFEVFHNNTLGAPPDLWNMFTEGGIDILDMSPGMVGSFPVSEGFNVPFLFENDNQVLAAMNALLEAAGSTPLTESKHLDELVSRPELTLSQLLEVVPRGTNYSSDVVTSVEIAIKYAGYIEREKLQAQKNNRLEYIKIPADFDFDALNGLSIECRQKLKRYKPETIAQAARISGVSPSDISVLLVYFGR